MATENLLGAPGGGGKTRVNAYTEYNRDPLSREGEGVGWGTGSPQGRVGYLARVLGHSHNTLLECELPSRRWMEHPVFSIPPHLTLTPELAAWV